MLCLYDSINENDFRRSRPSTGFAGMLRKGTSLPLAPFDILVSKSQEENTKLWRYREAIPPSETNEKICIQHDISIPLDCMDVFLKTTITTVLTLA